MKKLVFRNLELCKWLVDEKGANVNEKDKRGQTALIYATLTGHLDLCKWFCEKMMTDKDTISLRIEKEIDFTTEKYWKGFWERTKYKNGTVGLGVFGEDPDSKSKILAETHTFLWSGKTGNIKDSSVELNLSVQENVTEHDRAFYLIDKNSGIEFSSDTLVNGYRWERVKNSVLYPLIEEYGLEEYRKMQEAFTKKAYTIGGMIVFPRKDNAHKKESVNCQRGAVISDRVDLTIECIRRYFFEETNPLSKMSDVLEKNGDFFRLFGTGFDGFKAYIDFFFLNDIVSLDYKKVRSFIGTKEFLEQDAFSTSPFYPKNKEEWLQWKKNAVDFIDKRNQRILTALRDGTIEKRRA